MERIFNLQPEDSFSIFGTKGEVKILYATYNGIEFELFIDGKVEPHTFGHICFQSFEAVKMVAKTVKKGFILLLEN